MNRYSLEIDPLHPGKVLFIGNGILRLSKGDNWSDLLRKLNANHNVDLEGVPYAMQPEALCGTDVEMVQRKTASCISTIQSHAILQALLELDFDAVMTTNYCYEIEAVLSGKEWNHNTRKEPFATLYGSPHVRHNTYICNMVKNRNGKLVPVFHTHGELDRKHSLVLSYYSYANAVSRLIEMNKERGNSYKEASDAGNMIKCHGWLDYFILSDVYAIGAGFDTSEFDIWWAIERKSREVSDHGVLTAYMIDKNEGNAQKVLFNSMGVKCRYIAVNDEKYEDAYWKAYEEIKKSMEES